MKINKIPIIFVLAALQFIPSTMGEPKISPENAVLLATQQLFKVAKRNEALLGANPEKFYDLIVKNLEASTDFEGFAKGVMAKYYRLATEDQRRDFAEKFKTSLSRTYSKALLDFDSDSVTVKSSEIETVDRAKVLVEVKSSSGVTYPIIYSLRLIEGRWYLRNLVVNGINLGLQFRSQFNASFRLHKGDLDTVIKEWKVTDENS
ncbi:ABC transporter substrate-binding protein [Gammaproteobacteria bacterium]|nr:ABC transporter substrate-binding protein [Gammaproteobacteria bacterium]